MDKLINSEDVVANEINRWILVLMVGVMFTWLMLWLKEFLWLGVLLEQL
jgi:hypothetical protein